MERSLLWSASRKKWYLNYASVGSGDPLRYTVSVATIEGERASRHWSLRTVIFCISVHGKFTMLYGLGAWRWIKPHFLPKFLLLFSLNDPHKVILWVPTWPYQPLHKPSSWPDFLPGTNSSLEKSRIRPIARVARECPACIILKGLTSFDSFMLMPSALWSRSLWRRRGGDRVLHWPPKGPAAGCRHGDTTRDDYWEKVLLQSGLWRAYNLQS